MANPLDDLIWRMKESVNDKDWTKLIRLIEEYYKPIFTNQEHEHIERVTLYQREIELLKEKIDELRDESGFLFFGQLNGYNYYAKAIK